MKPLHQAFMLAVAASVSLAAPLGARPSQAEATDQASQLVQQAQQRLRDGQPDQAMALARQALAESPESVTANLQVGVLLDLTGQYKEARTHFATAIDKATSPQDSARALRSMAMSHAFEGDAKGATPYESKLYERYLAAADFYNAGEIADELARVCLEAGDLDAAEAWYRKGYDAGLREPGLSEARRDLWTFRWEHAQARIAARRGDRAAAERHVAAAKAVLDKGTNPEQLQFFPYLTGYVAFYAGDYTKALADLAKANQNDPFILSLTAQALEKTGGRDRAMDLYRRIMASTAHNPTAAFARPLARSKLQADGH
jgi:tetratricopeptide (TPR) repeat protein